MITIFQAVLLGALQGITEFLPVSSSGHLVLVQQIFGWKAENGIILAFDVALHVGTLCAVLVVFRRDIIDVLMGRAWRLFWLVVLATIPAVVMGFGFKNSIEAMFSSVAVVGYAWLFTGTFLWCTKYIRPSVILSGSEGSPAFGSISWLRSLLIGCAQAVAIIPGVSRSGSTMSMGMFLKLDGKMAARFSFLMAIPAILGGAVLDAKDVIAFPREGLPQIIIGTVVSFAVAYLSIKWLLSIIQKGKFHWFGVYCWLLGAGTLVYLYAR
ncbi:MAG: undecaprenyl-diphosphatase [Deltaproteobacteria bacterium CG11_big_fil_rev_8_21_14_0_20_49_13]|nr:MAG: undecaprenyl-diphosphatase [Deltaproteobacteria bacterium CG11_big_fil_rev_8_21_14_0_20_49_13]